MMRPVEALLAEFEHEAETTRRFLERLPEGKADWKPSPKSMPLGRLAKHLAEVPGFFGSILDSDELVIEGSSQPSAPAASAAEALAAFSKAAASFAAKLARTPDERLFETWRFVVNGRTVVQVPRAAAIRALVMSHLIHHRGQLSVYLRLLDVPVPGAYGPSADESM